METVLQDLRYGVRLLLKHRAFSSVAILTLALGIGASTALFSVIDAALLRPLPYPDPEQLVAVSIREADNGEWRSYAPSMTDIRNWRSAGGIFAHVGAGRVTDFRPLIVDAGLPERLQVGEASEDFLDVYGIAPLLGRSFQVEDTGEGAPLVALLGHAYWQNRFGGIPEAIGRVIRIAGVPGTMWASSRQGSIARRPSGNRDRYRPPVPTDAAREHRWRGDSAPGSHSRRQSGSSRRSRGDSLQGRVRPRTFELS